MTDKDIATIAFLILNLLYICFIIELNIRTDRLEKKLKDNDSDISYFRRVITRIDKELIQLRNTNGNK